MTEFEEIMVHSPAICEAAWKLYCEDTKGDMHVADFWDELSESVQKRYFERAMVAPYGGTPCRNRTSTP